jgi:hypothetical protein
MTTAERHEGGPRVLAMPGREWDDGAARGLLARLSAPFPADEVAWVPTDVRGDRAFVAPAVQPRAVMDRLDDVMGPAGWRDEYEERAGGLVYCRLTLAFPGLPEVTRADAAPVALRAARRSPYGDALATAAAKFGVGRYLDRVPREWVPFDEAKGRPAETPTLPPWALPEGVPDEVPPDEPEATPDAPQEAPDAEETAPESQAEPAADRPTGDDKPKGLWAWILACEAKAVARRECGEGNLVGYLGSVAELKKYGPPTGWSELLRPDVKALIVRWREAMTTLVGSRELADLDAQMTRTGIDWDDLRELLGGRACPPGGDPDDYPMWEPADLAMGQWQWLVAYLRSKPDARR